MSGDGKKAPSGDDEHIVFKKSPLLEKKHPDKYRGARKSLFSPEMQTILQHEAHKLRIIKLFLLLFVIAAAAGLICGVYSYVKSEMARGEDIKNDTANLLELAKKAVDESITLPERESNALRLMRRAQIFADRYGDEAGEKARSFIKTAEGIINSSFYREPSTNKYRSFTAGSAGIEMKFIAAGKYRRGASDAPLDLGWVNDRPKNEIEIKSPFWIAAKETDTWQMRRLVPIYRMNDWRGYRLDTPSRPAGRVSWTEAAAYCRALTELERKAGRVPPGYEYRLPTEAEWEYVCRAGTDTVYYWGNDFTNGAEYANSLDERAANAMNLDVEDLPNVLKKDAFAIAAPTGSLKPNAWGLYDMSGNVAEWCYDWYDPNAYRNESLGAVSPVNLTPAAVDFERKRLGNSSTFTEQIPCRSVRGGSWGTVPEKLRSAARDYMPPNTSNNSVGFRVVLAPVIK